MSETGTEGAPPATAATPGPPRTDLRRLVRPVLLAVAAFLALALGPAWVVVWFDHLVPRATQRTLAMGFLQTLQLGQLAGLALATIGLAVGLPWLRRARRRRAPWHGAAKLVLLSLATLLSLGLLEAAAAVWLARTHRLPPLPTRFEADPIRQALRSDEAEPALARGDADELHLVVVGESSAEGQPYHPHFSVGQVLAWQLEQMFPGRRVKLTMLATGGICLEQAILPLQTLRQRPDALLVYAGHNEFQARYGWSRSVAYYPEDARAPRPYWLAQRLAPLSPLCTLIAEQLDRQQVDDPPPPVVTRTLVDRPAFQRQEYELLRDQFALRLDGVADYARRVGAVPILIQPAGNDGDYLPARSFLDPATPAAERDAFAAAFEAAVALEASDPAAAEAAYRDLLARQPLFAESHFRLGRLRRAAGADAEAAALFVRARDLDGMPMRCPSDFLAAYDRVARTHGALLIDGLAVLRTLHPHGQLDEVLFHDGQHPTFRAYIALAQATLDGLAARGAFGWPQDRPAPTIDPVACAAHFGIDAPVWAEACRHSAFYYSRLAYTRHDPTPWLERGGLCQQAAERIDAGAAPEAVGLPGLGVHPTGLAAGLSPAAARGPSPSGPR